MTDFYSKAELLEHCEIDERLDQLPSKARLQKTIQNVRDRNIDVEVFDTLQATRKHLRALIPAGSTVMNGRSTTLKELGFREDLKTREDVEYLPPKIRALKDDKARQQARREAVTADVFIDSPNAIASTGEIVGVNGKGTSLGAWPYPARKLILVSGTNKIVSSLHEALDRVRTVAYPLENARVQAVQNHESMLGKWLIYEREIMDDRTRLVLLHGNFGY